MPAVATVYQNQAGYWYRINFPSGEYYIVGVELMTPQTGRQVFQTLNEDYALVMLAYPERSLAAFLSGQPWSPEFVQQEMGISRRPAEFISAILPALTLVKPADDILRLADQWYERS